MTKREAAFLQLRRAFLLFAYERDYLCTITLAGAADEILGKMARRSNGLEPAIEEEVKIIRDIMQKQGYEASDNEVRDDLLYPRNALKHLRIGEREDIVFDFAEEAEAIIDRAVTNYLAVTGEWPDDDAYDAYRKARAQRRNEDA